MSKTKKKHGKQPARRPAPRGESSHDDDVVLVPKGKSKGTYLFILGLMVFTLIIFTVGNQLQSSIKRGDQGQKAYMTWTHPERGEQEVGGREFLDVRRRLDEFFRVQGVQADVTAEQTATLIIADQMARDAGIDVADAEVGVAILQGFGSPLSAFALRPMQTAETYHAVLDAYHVTYPRFEKTVRQILRAERYKDLLAVSAGYPDPDDLLSTWKDENREHAYDWAEATVADYLEAAAADLPSDEELDAWYQGLENRNTVFQDEFIQERFAAELAGVRAGGDESAAGLLERYPGDGSAEPEELAREYFEKVRTRRFRRPEPAEDQTDPQDRLYFTYDEVSEACLREAPIEAALESWLADLTARADAGEIDLAAEAKELGLWYRPAGEPLDHTQWTELLDIGGVYLASALRSANLAPGKLTASLVVDTGGLFVGRVTEHVEGGLPEMSAIRDRVVEEWTREHAGELAVAALEELRAALVEGAGKEEGAAPDEGAEPSATVSEEDFRALAAAQGFAVGTRDWLPGWTTRMQEFQGQTFPIPISPADKDPDGELPPNAYIASDRSLEDLAEGELSAPALARDGEHAYLVRSRGSREPQDVRMSREAFQELVRTASLRRSVEFAQQFFSPEALRERYDLWLYTWDEPEGGEGEGA